MAENKFANSFDGIMSDLKAQKYAPVYLLMGEEAYFIDQISSYVENNVVDEDDRDFNQTVVFGADVTASQVADAARQYPMMAERRVVIVKEAQAMKSFEALEKYLDKPVPSTILVICYKNGSVDKRKKIVAKVAASGVVFESKKMKDSELPAFITLYLKKKSVEIDNKSAALIAEHIGSDLNRLTSELDKVLISLNTEPKCITPEVVEQQIGISKDFNAFELRNSIIRKDIFKANQIVMYFDKNPKSASLYQVIPMLFNFFQNLMIAHYAPNKNNEQALAAHMDLKSSWMVRDYVTGMRNYSALKTMQIIGKLREIDAKSKGLDNPNTSSGELMSELIFFILH